MATRLMVRYPTAEEAAAALEALSSAHIDVAAAERAEDDPVAADRSARAEASHIVMAPVVPMTGRQARGGFLGAILGGMMIVVPAAVIGIAMVALGIISWMWVAIIAIAAAAGGSVAGLIIGGWLGGEYQSFEDEAASHASMLLAVEPRDQQEVTVATDIVARTGGTVLGGPSKRAG